MNDRVDPLIGGILNSFFTVPVIDAPQGVAALDGAHTGDTVQGDAQVPADMVMGRALAGELGSTRICADRMSASEQWTSVVAMLRAKGLEIRALYARKDVIALRWENLFGKLDFADAKLFSAMTPAQLVWLADARRAVNLAADYVDALEDRAKWTAHNRGAEAIGAEIAKKHGLVQVSLGSCSGYTHPRARPL